MKKVLRGLHLRIGNGHKSHLLFLSLCTWTLLDLLNYIQKGVYARSREQTTSAHWESSLRHSIFEVDARLAGLVFNFFMTDLCKKVHFRSLVIAAGTTRLLSASRTPVRFLHLLPLPWASNSGNFVLTMTHWERKSVPLGTAILMTPLPLLLSVSPHCPLRHWPQVLVLSGHPPSRDRRLRILLVRTLPVHISLHRKVPH